LSDDRRQLKFTLTVEAGRLLLTGGPLVYEATVRVHRSDGAPLAGRIGEAIVLP
jgi:hypothetical protein